MRTRYTVIHEICVAFEDGREVWFLDSAYTRNDDILIGTESEVTAIICIAMVLLICPWIGS